MTDSPGDVTRRQALRRMQTIATGLLVAAFVVWLATLRWRHQVLVGFVNAGAEAAMVGALADWFAVVAIFRHPLGIPIPHTALVKRKKDSVGKSLESFVRDNFLTEDILRQRMAQAHLAERLGQWLATESNRRLALGWIVKGLRRGLGRVRDEDVAELISETLIPKMEGNSFAPTVGAFIEGIVKDKAHTGLMDIIFREIHEWLSHHPRQFKSVVSERLPMWAPSWADRRLVDWAYTQALGWAKDVRDTPQHRVRSALDDLLAKLARDLQTEGTVRAHADNLKKSVLANPQFAATTNEIWHSVRDSLDAALADQDSALWRRGDGMLAEFSENILTKDELRASIDRRGTEGVVFLMDSYGEELLGIISSTIESWEPEKASDRIELFVGKDLQYIRINGTVVGSLAGLLIHAIRLFVG